MSGEPTAENVREWGERYSNWGRWGQEDQRGTLNFITRRRVVAACGLPRSGRIISCALPPSATSRPTPCRTQWQPLSGVAYAGKHYNGRDAAPSDTGGPAADSIHHAGGGLIGRGVLLDLPRHLRLPWLDDGTRILPADLDACAESFGVTVEPGDIVLVRTGQMKRCIDRSSWEGYCGGPAPGLSIHCARWIYEREIAALAGDTWCVEVRPNETADCVQPLHRISQRDTGLLLGENFALDALSDACAEDGNYAFLFVAPPLGLADAAGAPVSPLVVK
jgi:kynurenine formamidase